MEDFTELFWPFQQNCNPGFDGHVNLERKYIQIQNFQTYQTCRWFHILLRIVIFWRALDFSSRISILCRSTFLNLVEFGLGSSIESEEKSWSHCTLWTAWTVTHDARFSVCVLKIRRWLKNLRCIHNIHIYVLAY